MTKREIFDHIIDACARVCSVSVDEIMEGRKHNAVVIARSIAVFWLNAASFSVDDILRCTGRSNHNCIDCIKSGIEDRWKEDWDYHVYIEAVGQILHEIGQNSGIDFDRWKPIRRIQSITGKIYYPNI